MEALGHRAVGEKRPDAAGVGTGDAQRVRESLAVEPEYFGGSRGRAEGAARAARMPAQVIVRAIAAGAIGHTGRDVVTSDDRRQRFFARNRSP
jgi:hypothetical protein